MPSMTDVRKQAVTGVVPPQVDESLIRQVWPSVAAFPTVAALGRVLMRTILLAPLAWLLLAPFYFRKILPFLATRYVLTNRHVLILRGWRPRRFDQVPQSDRVALADIDDVRLVEDANTEFYRAANLEIISQGKPVLLLRGVPNPESFRHAILNAVRAWVPGKFAGPFVSARETTEKAGSAG